MIERDSDTTYDTDGLNEIFAALSDPTRRDIVERLRLESMNVSAIASEYDASLAAVAKHVALLEEAGLVYKRKQGKERIVSLIPTAFARAAGYMDQFGPTT